MAQQKFETALEDLERIVEKLEDSELPLDDALRLFEEGIKLSQFCSGTLEQAEQKVELLLKDADGVLQPKPFDAGDSES